MVWNPRALLSRGLRRSYVQAPVDRDRITGQDLATKALRQVHRQRGLPARSRADDHDQSGFGLHSGFNCQNGFISRHESRPSCPSAADDSRSPLPPPTRKKDPVGPSAIQAYEQDQDRQQEQPSEHTPALQVFPAPQVDFGFSSGFLRRRPEFRGSRWLRSRGLFLLCSRLRHIG